MRRKKKGRIFRLFLISLFLFLLLLGVGRQFLVWKKSDWDGKRQLSLAIETQSKKIIIFALTPEKNMAVALVIPPNLKVETPWFGAYRADKLSLLAKQEGKSRIFSRSLGFFLGIPIDREIINSGIILHQADETEIKRILKQVFSPWRSLDNFRVWSWLRKRELVWRVVDLEAISQEETLPDGSVVLTIDPERIADTLLGIFTDPLVKNENIAISVFNSGGTPGMARRTAAIITSFGGRVVEVTDSERKVDDCLVLFSQERLAQSTTLKRLESVLGCPKEQGRKEGLGEIQIFIKNVKI